VDVSPLKSKTLPGVAPATLGSHPKVVHGMLGGKTIRAVATLNPSRPKIGTGSKGSKTGKTSHSFKERYFVRAPEDLRYGFCRYGLLRVPMFLGQ
jgi:hypothetical protein